MSFGGWVDSEDQMALKSRPLKHQDAPWKRPRKLRKVKFPGETLPRMDEPPPAGAEVAFLACFRPPTGDDCSLLGDKLLRSQIAREKV